MDIATGAAYDPNGIEGADAGAAHLFLQRILYRINRLTLFWYDDLRGYRNERSRFVFEIRSQIEESWRAWEEAHVSTGELQSADVVAELRARTARDLDPPPSPAGEFFRDQASLAAYRRLLAITSLDALVEASQLSRTLGGVSNRIHATMTKLLIEEYGGGRLAKKHSSYFAAMLEASEMDTKPEFYFDFVPWEVLSTINFSFLLCDRKQCFLRYVGGLLYTEMSVPAAFRCYRAAALRLNLPAAAMKYWDLHIKEDARHGPWMLNDVAIPLSAHYPDDAWEILLGYDQQRFMSARAGAATAEAAANAH